MEPRQLFRGKSLLQLLTGFSDNERSEFRRYLYSPFFNKRLTLDAPPGDPRIVLFEAIDRHWDKIMKLVEEGIDKQPLVSAVYADVFGAEAEIDLQRFSRAVMALEEMVISYAGLPNHAERYRAKESTYTPFQLEFFQARGMHAAFEDVLRHIRTDQEKSAGNLNWEDLLNRFFVELEVYRYRQRYQSRTDLNLLPMLDALRDFYRLGFLEHYAILSLPQNNIPSDISTLAAYTSPLMEEASKSKNLLDTLYYESILLLQQAARNEISIEQYKRFLNILEHPSIQLTQEQQYLFYGFLRNYCMVGFNLGQDVFLKQLYRIYQFKRNTLYLDKPGRQLSVNQFYPMFRMYLKYGLAIRLQELRESDEIPEDGPAVAFWEKTLQEISRFAPVRMTRDEAGNIESEMIWEQARLDGQDVEGIVWLIRAELHNCLQEGPACRHFLDKVQSLSDFRRIPVYALIYSATRCRFVFDDMVSQIRSAGPGVETKVAALKNIDDNLRHIIEDLKGPGVPASIFDLYKHFANSIKVLSGVLIKIQYVCRHDVAILQQMPYVSRKAYTFDVMMTQLTDLEQKVNNPKIKPGEREWLRVRIAELQQWLTELKLAGMLPKPD